MAALYTYNSTHLTTVRDGTELTNAADHGAVGNGSLVIDDTAGTLSIVGQKDFRYNESSASSNSLVWKGYIAGRDYGRNAGFERAPDLGASRAIQVSLVDINDRLNHLLIQQGGKRPAETVEERLEWLLASDYVDFADRGRVSYPDDDMDKADYKYQYAGDVLADCALAAGSGWNYYVTDFGSGPELVFRNDNTSTADSSDLRISNVATDIDSDHDTLGATKTFGPFVDATLHRDPTSVHSKHAKSYAKGTAVEERAATATAFNGERGGTSSNSNIKRLTQARRAARRELNTHSTEDDVIDVTIQVPASAVNLIPAGWRLQCKFSHFATEGYGSFTWMRVLERTVRPMESDAFAYEIALKLVPQEAADPADACDDDATPAGTHYPLGGTVIDDPGFLWGISDGVVYYLKPGLFYPTTPTPGLAGTFHFAQYGTGGAGSIDWAGDCVQSTLRFIVVGNGTLTVQTEIYAGSPRPMSVSKSTAASHPEREHVANFTSGESVAVTIDDTGAADCVRIIDFGDGPNSPCGGKWGWSSAVWVAA